MKKLPFILLFAFFLSSLAGVHAQIIYFAGQIPGVTGAYIWRINMATCEYCPVLDYEFPNPGETPYGLLILPDGDILAMLGPNGSGEILRFSPPDNSPVATISGFYQAGFVHPNGTIYMTVYSSLYTFDPLTNTITLVGNYPVGVNTVQEMFYANGQLYVTAYFNNIPCVVQVDVNDPLQSVVVQNTPLIFVGATTAQNDSVYVNQVHNTPNIIYRYNVTTNTLTPACSGIPVLSRWAFTVAPAGVPDLDCVCLLSSAGTPIPANVESCVPDPITVDFNNDQDLDYNDIVHYALYTDPADPLGSIVQINNTPAFNYSAPLMPDITYYVVRLVGDSLNGNINLLDPCLDISPEVSVLWRPQPTVTISVDGTNSVCPGGCIEVVATFTGIPPFTLRACLKIL